MGVVLNRPSETTVAEAAAGPGAARGGRRARPRRRAGQPGGRRRGGGGRGRVARRGAAARRVGFLRGDLDLEDEDVLAGVLRARVFAGYAGWTPGQLDVELETTDWLVEPAGPDDLFAEPGADLWAEVVRRKGGPYRLIATMPFDPTLN